MTARSESRYASLAAGQKTYEGIPCKCGAVLRYLRNRACVACQPARWSAESRKRRERKAAEKHLACSRCGAADKTPSGDCRPCMRLSRNRRNEREGALRAAKGQDLFRRYGITIDQFELLLLSQGNACAICRTGNPPKQKHKQGWCVDHDHESGAVRGILCNRCNTGLGLFGDSVERLKSASEYLDGELRLARRWFAQEAAWAVGNLNLGDV